MSDALREIIEGVTRHRVRAAATAFGVFWGIFMLTLLLGGGAGLRNGFTSLFDSAALNTVWVEAGRTTQPFEGLGAGRQIAIDLADLAAIERSIPQLHGISPRQPLRAGLTIRRGTRTLALPTYGVYASFAAVAKLSPVRGRLLNELDVTRARKVAVIGTRARALLFGEANPIGQRIAVGGVDMTVVGEFDDAGGDEPRRRIYLPYSTLVQSFDGSTTVSGMVALLDESADAEQVRSTLKRLLGRRHRFAPSDVGALEVFFMSEEFKRLQSLLRGIDLAIFVVGFGTLLSGMVGVSNILFVSIRERAQEFGVRRALGATARSILLMVIAEALILSVFSGGLGLLSALGAIELVQSAGVQSEFFKDPQVHGSAVLGALTILVATALVAGFFPAREAARMTPIAALRRE
ncbi:MAG: ABC transporter permease [Polyangiales bacterium]